MATTTTQTDLFVVRYEIGGTKPGAPNFALSLSVNPVNQSVGGVGRITQTTNPPLNLDTVLSGNSVRMCVMPDNCHILVRATGTPPVTFPPHGGIGPVIPPNVDLTMVLTENWAAGTANYRYMDGSGKWHDVKDAPVKIAPEALVTAQ